MVKLEYFNLQYLINSKNSINLELSSTKNGKNLLSIQNRYSIMKNEKIYSGLSISTNKDFNIGLGSVFGSSFNFSNSAIIGLITSIPFTSYSNSTINLYLGVKL